MYGFSQYTNLCICVPAFSQRIEKRVVNKTPSNNIHALKSNMTKTDPNKIINEEATKACQNSNSPPS